MPAKIKLLCRYLLITVCLIFTGLTTNAYSILAHEAIIDASWKPVMVPMLRQKYPNITREEILLAHSYAYGGSIVADMGYMPFGNGFFTDLVHYVRSGDFIENMISDARNLNEYAFALGALSHYMADKYGHSLSTNVNVPLIYPKLKKKYGDVVTYNDDHTSHSRMEFAYDVMQIGHGSYTSEGYHNFIGFNMAVPVLERAFYKTYGQELSTIFSNIGSSINTMRWGVRNLFPVLTKAAFDANKDEIRALQPGMTVKKFRYQMGRRSFDLQYGKEHQESKFFSKVIVFLIKILPKVGPLKTLKFKSPGPEGEKLFAKSFDAILKNYNQALKDVGDKKLVLADINFDTGTKTHLGEYKLADKTYAELVKKLHKKLYRNVTPQLQQDILKYYSTADTAKFMQQKPEKWAELNAALTQMKVFKPVPQDSLILSVEPGEIIVDLPKN